MEENSRERTEARQRYNELLRELRTIIPGVQVLFGFLLTVPFSTRFDRITEGSKVMFVISLMAAAVATICLLGSAAYHRVAGRPERKRRLHYGMRLSLAGMAFLAISVSCALFVVGRFLYSSVPMGLALSISNAALSILIWFLIPLLERWRRVRAGQHHSPTTTVDPP